MKPHVALYHKAMGYYPGTHDEGEKHKQTNMNLAAIIVPIVTQTGSGKSDPKDLTSIFIVISVLGIISFAWVIFYELIVNKTFPTSDRLFFDGSFLGSFVRLFSVGMWIIALVIFLAAIVYNWL